MTFIALAQHGQGAAVMAGEVRAVCDPDNEKAEFAIQIASGWQRLGLGRLLLGKLVRYLRERGTGEVVGQCLAENAGMASLARSLGFEVTPVPSEDTMAMRLVLRAP
jgi:acetyltransferase